MDSRFTVKVLSQSPNPQQAIYAAMHQDYSEAFVWDDRSQFPDEEKAGELVIRNLLAGNRGHFGPLEHPQIVLNIGWFPHSCMQQIRTHRVGVSFDVQSFRYTGTRIVAVAEGKTEVEEVFYLRPLGFYTDRQGKKYEYTESVRQEDIAWCLEGAKMYKKRIEQGFSEEHARSLIPFDVRQHWVMSANARSVMHLLDLRAKGDAQLEAQQMCELIWPHFEAWVPAVAAWYHKQRWAKARLSP
ncbi:FAD-dependent thymidylate synthase [filamentous cyanobacterium LEGE 11480]|uniref:FAD-dependent thymidylate synthase n=1 Tax=Romeriopsis navalis LEGE 11480 TaxID=2777977 RepID=A0A928VLK2_9CYAN|nr:FAD-dependent thymidylate synthase [Romeriopsis navalis]MBE9028612.1 FAD-dependent thymidylate synthase [Romeriopsis navalis LEGE 11480]